jgi:hypothetical protein
MMFAWPLSDRGCHPACAVLARSRQAHQDTRQFSFPAIPAILIRKAKGVAFCEPTLSYQRMEEELLANWKTNPRPLLHWSEAFSAFRRCLEALPSDAEAVVTDRMISAKREFHWLAQEVRTPSKVLFVDIEAEAEAEGFEDGAVPLLSLFKPSVDLGSTNLLAKDKKLAKQVCMAEDSLSVVTHNLIHQRGALEDQDKILRSLEARVDLVQDHLGTTPFGLSSDFEAPTLNGRVALLAEKFATLHGPSSPPELQITEPQVVE